MVRLKTLTEKKEDVMRALTLIVLTMATVIMMINIYYIATNIATNMPPANENTLFEAGMGQMLAMCIVLIGCFVFPAIIWIDLGLNLIIAVIINIAWIILGVAEIARSTPTL